MLATERILKILKTRILRLLRYRKNMSLQNFSTVIFLSEEWPLLLSIQDFQSAITFFEQVVEISKLFTPLLEGSSQQLEPGGPVCSIDFSIPYRFDKIKEARIVYPKIFESKHLGLGDGGVNLDFTRDMIRCRLGHRENQCLEILKSI